MAPRAVSRFARAALSGVLVASAMVVVLAQEAAAATGPIQPPTSTMVSSDALPTVQINGVVWQQAIVGNRVYAGGSFSTARPAGAAPGVNEVTRSNLLAYDITTGALIDSFAPAVNGQIRAVTASPDGTRIYVGGDFTAIGGVTRSRIAAFDAVTGALLTAFDARVDYTVRSLVVTNNTVYAGGAFANSRGVARARLAAFSTSTGALLGWNPGTDGTVNTMVMSPDGSKLIIGGAFTTVNGAGAYGMAALNPTTGALMTWNATQKIKNAGKNSAITSLTTDGASIFGSGYRFGTGGNLEGSFRLSPSNGDIIWLEDCHGDTYDTAPLGGVLYTVSHAHFCGNIGGFYQTDPWSGNMRHALAFSNEVTGTINEDKLGYFDWQGTPSPSLYNWFPDMTNGSYTGQTQAAWDVTSASNGQYLVLGGEFPTVNGVNQQGLVRFAVKTIAPNKDGARVSGAAFAPRLAALNSTDVRVSWQSNWDRDDLTLTYSVYRDGVAVSPPITADSTFWNRPSLSFIDFGVPAGNHVYRIDVVDGSKNLVSSSDVAINPQNTVNSYVRAVLTDGAGQFWRLGEGGGNTAFDSAGFTDAPIASVTRGTPGAILGDSNTATTFAGTQASEMGTSVPVQGPNTFTIEAWFKTNTTVGGKIVGFGNQPLIDSTSYDRQIYMNNAGRLYFGVNNGSARTVTSTASFNDDQWHHAVATLGSTGMRLYVDGVQVGSNTAVTSAQNYQGYWRVGGDQTRNWTGAPTSNYFAGAIDDVAIYPVALSATQVTNHYQVAMGTAANQAPVASFVPSVTNLGVSVNAAASSDPDGTIASYSWNWGDSTAADSGQTATHSYTAAGNYTITLTVTDNQGLTSTASQPITTTTPPANQSPIASFSSVVTNQSVAFNAAGSSDPDGTIASYSWNWGDSTAAGSGVNPTHLYAAAGTYTVTLTVTDDDNASTSISNDVITTEAPNAAPVAAFTSGSTGLTATVNSSTSTDSDGTIVGQSWSWGDGTPDGSGVSATHPYAAAGTYSVTLTVTDDDGATNSTSRNVTVSTAVVGDTFARNITNGWGNADAGGPWSVTTGSSNRFLTNGQSGAILATAAGQTNAVSLNSLSVRDYDGVVDLSIDKAATGSGVYETISTRKIGSNSYQFTLKFLASNTVSLAIVRVDAAGSSNLLASTVVPGLTYAVGEAIRVRFQTIGSGTTTLAVKAWKASAAEPAAFFATRTDSSAALQAPGGFGLTSYVSSNATVLNLSTIVDNLAVTGN